ncbi:hypothetical protein Cni_G27920 [Canna indica]|uniref:Uncharacterized protein n=1 Tax=Canna indica TaxID=4628 RepID=A0AAQ3QRS5_9LILI|nr:hypothetical protein Cni_G27920 [Canna indica]
MAGKEDQSFCYYDHLDLGKILPCIHDLIWPNGHKADDAKTEKLEALLPSADNNDKKLRQRKQQTMQPNKEQENKLSVPIM